MRAPSEPVDYARYRVIPGERFRLGSVRPDDTQDHPGKKLARRQMEESMRRLSSLQERLYAESERSVLLVLQAMDGGGKDSTIRRVFGGVKLHRGLQPLALRGRAGGPGPGFGSVRAYRGALRSHQLVR